VHEHEDGDRVGRRAAVRDVKVGEPQGAGDAHTERLLLYGEVIAGPFLLLAMFGGSLVVGLRALAPVEQSRRRQLEFTAGPSYGPPSGWLVVHRISFFA